jgi:hypothetical protein
MPHKALGTAGIARGVRSPAGPFPNSSVRLLPVHVAGAVRNPLLSSSAAHEGCLSSNQSRSGATPQSHWLANRKRLGASGRHSPGGQSASGLDVLLPERPEFLPDVAPKGLAHDRRSEVRARCCSNRKRFARCCADNARSFAGIPRSPRWSFGGNPQNAAACTDQCPER